MNFDDADDVDDDDDDDGCDDGNAGSCTMHMLRKEKHTQTHRHTQFTKCFNEENMCEIAYVLCCRKADR